MQYYYIIIIHFFQFLFLILISFQFYSFYSFFRIYSFLYLFIFHVISAMKQVIHKCNSKIARTLQLHACIIYFMVVLVFFKISCSSKISLQQIFHFEAFLFISLNIQLFYFWLIFHSFFQKLLEKNPSLVNSILRSSITVTKYKKKDLFTYLIFVFINFCHVILALRSTIKFTTHLSSTYILYNK